MKAADIMMWLLVFNLVIWLLGGYGLNIYNLGNYQIDIDNNSINSSRPYSATEETSSRALGFFLLILAVIAAMGGYGR